MTSSTAQILNHPAKKLVDLQNARFRCICEAIYYKRRGDRDNQSYCQGKASGLNEAIVMLGGDGISLRLEDYMDAASKSGDAA